MFNIEKILLFVVTMITTAAFLFFIPQIHIQIDWAPLFTHHRIKVGLTLLSPIIFGAITAYIAYQQHRLAKTQANISKDQRDIAHNKQRMENYNFLYDLVKPFSEVIPLILSLPYSIPNILRTEKIHEVLSREISDEETQFSDKEKEWSQFIFRLKIRFEEKISECFISRNKLEYMLDEKTISKIDYFLRKSEKIFEDRWFSLSESVINKENSKERIEQIEKIIADMKDLRTSNIRMNQAIKKYMDIRDIISPRKFGE